MGHVAGTAGSVVGLVELMAHLLVRRGGGGADRDPLAQTLELLQRPATRREAASEHRTVELVLAVLREGRAGR